MIYPKELLEKLVIKAAEKHKLDVDLVSAIVEVESSWNPFATRFEPSTERYVRNVDIYALNNRITQPTERIAQMHSYGLMQLMGFLCRDLNFQHCLTEMLDPATNLDYGCTHLKNLFVRYEEEEKVISAYNQGSPRMTPGGMYQNQSYVNKVYAILLNKRALN